MLEEEAFKFSTLHLEGVAHKWWYHGLVTQGHNSITTLEDFNQRLMERFDRKDPKTHFRELTQLKQEGKMEEGKMEDYSTTFQRLAVMIFDVSKTRLIVFFIQGLAEPLKGLVKAFNPSTLQEAINRALIFEDSVTRDRWGLKQTILMLSKNPP